MFQNIRRTVTLVLIFALLVTTLGTYPVFAGKDNYVFTSVSSNNQYEHPSADEVNTSMTGQSSNDSVTKGYTQLNIDDLMDSTDGMADTDGDGLADDVEKVLGLDSEESDTDQDNLDDYYETTHGLDPLHPDTNRDGLADYYEILEVGEDNEDEMSDDDVNSDKDTDGDGIRNVDDMDNDNDGVIDGMDISPFSFGEASEVYEIDIETSGKDTYINIQIRPEDVKEMYEKNQIFDWPYDTEGNIMDSDMTQDDLRIQPMLEVVTDNLPSEEQCEKYGIILDNGKMHVTLNPVIDRGQMVAYEGKAFIPAGATATNLKIKLSWTLLAQVDNASYKWEEIPSTYGGEKEYISAGTATGDIDGDGFTDVVVSGIEGVEDGVDRFYYSISYHMELDGTWDEFSGMIKVPVDFPEVTSGSGIALGFIDNNDTLDIVCMAVESVSGADRFVYAIGYDLDENGTSNEWTTLINGPQIGHSNQGGGLSIADLDDNGLSELIFMAIDNPDGANHFRYTVRWNFNPKAADAYEYNPDEWSDIFETNDIGHKNQGGSIEVVNLDGDDKPELLFTCVDDPDRYNSFWHYIAWDINTDPNSSKRGKYSLFSDHSKYDLELGYHSEGCGMAIGDFDKDGNDDIIVVNVDDVRGKKNSFWYWVGDHLNDDGGVESFSEKHTYSGIKGGLKSSLDQLNNAEMRGLDCAVYDLDGNGIDDLHMVWINSENQNVYLTTGWDLNEDGQVRGWQNPKIIDYAYSNGGRGLGLAFYDVDGDDKDDLITAFHLNGNIMYDTLKNLEWKGHYSFQSSSGRSHRGVLIDLSNDFNGIDNLTESDISGVGVTYQDVNDNGKVDVVISYNKTYTYYEVTIAETDTKPEERRYFYKNENRVDVLYDVNIPNTVNDSAFSYESRDRFILYTYNRHKDTTDINYEFPNEGNQMGVGIEVGDYNGDDKLDALLTSAVDRGKDGEFYYIIQYDFLSNNSELQIRKCNDNDEWLYNDLEIQGVGVTDCNFDNYNLTDAVAILYDEKSGFQYFKNENIETKAVPILKEYEPFVLVGIQIEENNGAQAGIIHCELDSSIDNDLKAMSVFEVLRGHFLKDENDIDEGMTIVRDDFDIDGVTLENESFDHADQVAIYIDDNTAELFEGASGNHVPIIVGITNESRALTLDAVGKCKVQDAHLSFNMTDTSFSTTKMLQLQWYDAEEEEMVDTEGLVEGINSSWGWDIADDETKMNSIALLTQWQMGEVKMTHIDNDSILPEKKLWSASWWTNTLVGGAKRVKDIVGYSRQGYSGVKVISKIWSYKGGITGFAKNMANYYNLMNGLRVTDANVWKIKNALDVDTFTGVQSKFVSGSKMKFLSKWGTRAGLAFDLGLAVYRGAEIGSAYSDEGVGYAVYSGTVYSLLRGGYSTALFLIPKIAKIKYAAAGTGVGALIVALIELSDLITFFACGQGWSTMVIGKIFNALVGKCPDVEVGLEMTSSDLTYEGMENGFYVVGSSIENEMSFHETIEDIDKGHYDEKELIDNNYAKPKVEYATRVEGVEIDNNKDVETSYKKRDGLWWVYRDYDFDNTVKFANIGINVPITSIFNIYTKIHIHKKGPGKDYYEKDSDINEEKLYFDVLPMQLDEFYAGFNFDTSYENDAEIEPLSDSQQRAVNNEIVIVDEDGDGLLIDGIYEKNSDGERVDSDPDKADTDGDGIDDNYEDALGSDPRNPDTDDDGLGDRDEMLYMTSLTESDTDEDGLTDKEEIDGYQITINFNGQTHNAHVHSDPLNDDTDGDGVSDADEKANGTNPASRYTHGQKRLDGNDHDPSMKQPLHDINDKSIGDEIILDFNEYFEDLDGDELTYSVDVGTVDGSQWTYIYDGGLVEVTVLAKDGRDGDREELFVINDTTNPYMSATYFNSDEAHTDAIDGAENVYGSSVMHIEYNENVMFVTDPSSITLIDEDAVPVAFTATINDNVLCIDPVADMVEDWTGHTLTIPAGCIQDLNSNLTEHEYAGTFTTQDTTGPKVTSCNRIMGDTIPGTQVLTLSDPITYEFHESLRSYNRYPVFVGPDESTWTAWDLDTTVDAEAGSMTSFIKQDALEDNTYYRFYPNVLDPYNNKCDQDFVGFTTGDVTSPDLLLAVYYTGDSEIKYMMKVQSNVIEIPYDEALFEGVNFDQITLEEVMTQNIAKPIVSRAAQMLGASSDLVEEIEDTDLTTVPIDVQIVGTKLVITALTGLVPNCMYSLVIPQGAVKDANNLAVLELEDIRVTFDDSDKPEVYSSGFTSQGEIDIAGNSVNNPSEDIYIVFNEAVRKTSPNSVRQITLVDSSGNEVPDNPYLLEWPDAGLYGAGMGQVIRLGNSMLEEGETYTLTVPAGTVENILGYGNDLYIKEFTCGEFSMPAIEDDTFEVIGNTRVGEKVYAHYVFERYNELYEGLSTYQWYRGTNPDGSDKVAIPGATELSYVIGPDDIDKYLFFEVTPILSDGAEVVASIASTGLIMEEYSANNHLKLLQVINDEQVVLYKTPEIDNYYEVVVPSEAKEVTVKAQQDDSKAYVKIYYDGITEEAGDGGEQTVPLWFGENKVTITVTNEKGTNEQVYTLMIERDRSDEHLFKPDGYCEIRQEVYYESGKIYVDGVLHGDTYFYDDEKRDEGQSEYGWYKSSDSEGEDKILIGQGKSYTVTSDDVGYYIFFGYTPMTDSAVKGDEFLSEPTVKISGSSGTSEPVAPDSEFDPPSEPDDPEPTSTSDPSTDPSKDDDDTRDEFSDAVDITDTSDDGGDSNKANSGILWFILGGLAICLAGGATVLIMKIKFKHKRS